MEPIIYNRKNENIFLPAYVTVDKRFRFSQGAITLIGLKMGKYLHLLEFGDNDWYFMIDDDPSGLRFGLEGTHIVAHAVKICRAFIARASKEKRSHSVSFYLCESDKEYKGKRLWRIELDKIYISKRSEKPYVQTNS
jgi:hypothetical protein